MNPQQNHYGQGQIPQAAQGYMAAHALTAALTNPYAQTQQVYYPQASHYAQAYAGTSNAAYGYPGTIAGGYTLYSTYVPGTAPAANMGSQNQRSAGPSSSRPSRPQRQTQDQGYWYQPGNIRCSKPGCTFMGSQKAVETHMMDRHLVYPPGWENRKRKSDWDADPTLKGCPANYPTYQFQSH